MLHFCSVSRPQTLSDLLQNALHIVGARYMCWLSIHRKLKYFLPFPFKSDKFKGMEIAVSTEVKYLRVNLDHKLNYWRWSYFWLSAFTVLGERRDVFPKTITISIAEGRPQLEKLFLYNYELWSNKDLEDLEALFLREPLVFRMAPRNALGLACFSKRLDSVYQIFPPQNTGQECMGKYKYVL